MELSRLHVILAADCTILYCEGRKNIQYSNSVDMNTLG